MKQNRFGKKRITMLFCVKKIAKHLALWDRKANLQWFIQIKSKAIS